MTDGSARPRTQRSTAMANMDILHTLAEYIVPKQYVFLAPVSKVWREAWGKRPPVTVYATADSTVSQLRYSLDCNLPRDRVQVCAAIARVGSVEVLQFARASGCVWDHTTTAQAARAGALGLLRWATQAGCPRTEETCASAARGGHLGVLRHLRETGCPWNERTCFLAAMVSKVFELVEVKSILNVVALLVLPRNRRLLNNRAHCIPIGERLPMPVSEHQRAYSNSPRMMFPRHDNFSQGGHLDILKYARANGCGWHEDTSLAAAGAGFLGVLRWAIEEGCPCNWRTCSAAAGGGHLEILKFLREKGCAWNSSVCSSAALGGHSEVVEYAFENGCPFSSRTPSMAATGGHLSLLRWFRENRCPWDERTTFACCKEGHLASLKYAREHSCPWDFEACLSVAGREGHADVVEWLQSSETRRCGDDSKVVNFTWYLRP